MDPVWEEKYAAGHSQRYPWDQVVSFVYRHRPRSLPPSETRILEVGFGTGSNLWFAAREGFNVAGIEGSASAVKMARQRFTEEGLVGELLEGDFEQLPFADSSFNLAIDRAALACVGDNGKQRSIAEIQRVLVKGGRFYFNTYADDHASSRTGEVSDDGLVTGIKAGNLVGVGGIHFVSEHDLQRYFSQGWKLLSIEKIEHRQMLVTGEPLLHSEWVVVAEKDSTTVV